MRICTWERLKQEDGELEASLHGDTLSQKTNKSLTVCSEFLTGYSRCHSSLGDHEVLKPMSYFLGIFRFTSL